LIKRLAVTKPQSSPMVLKYTDVRSYVFTAAFISLDVFTPWLFHQFYLAGPTFLPMHIFVLLAGLLFGWRAGLVVGLFTPLVSYAISGMPVLAILPQIIVELSIYGLIAGILREKFNLRVIWSLTGAMIAGRLALFLVVVLIIQLGGQIHSPLGLETNPSAVLWSTIKQGWLGVVIQLASVPLMVWLLERFVLKNSRRLNTFK